jgi:hypothetical protein
MFITRYGLKFQNYVIYNNLVPLHFPSFYMFWGVRKIVDSDC